MNSFMTFGTHLDPNEASYYTNITGFIRGDVSFHNITPPSLAMANNWESYAVNMMNGTNMTEVAERASSWNWTGSDKVALSVVEKDPAGAAGKKLNLTEDILLVHVSHANLTLRSIRDLMMDMAVCRAISSS